MTFNNDTQEITLRRKLDGSISFDFVMINKGDVTAKNGGLTVRICDLCKYFAEPAEFRHIAGSGDKDRQFHFDHLLARASAEKHTIAVVPDTILNRFEVDIMYACDNCIAGDKQVLWVNVDQGSPQVFQ